MTEAELIAGCVKEKRSYQEELYKRFAGKMMAVCMRYSRNRAEAEDILQDSFVKVFDNISRFEQKGSLEGWIRRIIVNTALNKIRQEKQIFESIETENYHISDSTQDSAYEKLTENDIMGLINQLPAGYKYVFNMFAIEGYSHAEIADKLGIGEATSRSQYAKARRYLQNLIQKTETVRL